MSESLKNGVIYLLFKKIFCIRIIHEFHKVDVRPVYSLQIYKYGSPFQRIKNSNCAVFLQELVLVDL